MRASVTRTLILLAAILIVCVGVARAGDIELTLQVDQKVITMQDTLTVQVSLSGAGGGNLNLPDSPLFQIVGTSSGQNVVYAEGKLTRQKNVTYTMMPIKAGRTRLGPATVRIGKKTYKSNTVEVEVVHSQNLVPEGTKSPTDASQEIFLKAEASPKSPYLGGQVTVSLYLYTRANISGLSFSELPDFKDFWAEELLAPTRPQFQETEINGVPYRVALIRRYALFPLKEGQTSIDSFGMTAEIRSKQERRKSRRRSSWPFDVFDEDPFGAFGRVVQKELRSPVINIDVQPLPKEEQPAAFQNVVGRFKMKVSMDKTKVAVGDPVTMKMIISGEGNFKTLVSPKANIPDSFNTYSETSDQDIKTTSEKVGGTKTYSMILVPREQGDFSIGPVTLDYFDPEERVYKQLSAGPLNVSVSGEGKQVAAPNNLPITQQEVTAQGTDIRYIRADAKHLKEVKGPYYLHPGFLALIFVWPPLLIVLFMVQRYRKAALADADKLRSRRAGRVSRTRLKQAKALLSQEQDRFYNELTSAILGFIADKTVQASSGIVVSTLIVDLAKAGASDDLCQSLKELFDEADAVRYGGRQADEAARKAALEKAYRIIDELSQKKLLRKVRKK